MGGEQAISTLRFDPALPLWALAILAALGLAAVGVALARRARGAVWRLAALAVLIAWMAGPRLVRESRQVLPDIGLVVIDRTASMQMGERGSIAERARAAIEKQAGTLPDMQLRIVEVAEAGHDGTQLFAAIERALADIPRARLAGIVAVTDGQVHDIPATPTSAPLHVLVPAKGEEVNRRLRIIEAPSFGLVGHPVTLKVAVDDLGLKETGARGPASAQLTIRRDGEPPVVESVPVGREHRIELAITRAGPTVVELSVNGLPGEVSAINNRAVIEVNGVRERLRVLLVSGEPHPGERTWRRLLKADPSVDLVHFTILRPPDKDDMTPLNELALIAFPVRELFQVKIKEFDLIILDRFTNRGVLPFAYLRNIADFVKGGGGLLLSVGPEFTGPASLAVTPLGAVLPAKPGGTINGVLEGGFRPALTPVGKRHPVTGDLPDATSGKDGQPGWGEWYRRLASVSSQGESLMAGPDGAPLLLLDRVGEGRTALLMSDQIWLWSRGHEGGGPQGELLRRLAHWLMKEPELEENALTARVADGVLTITRRSTEEQPPSEVSVTDPDGKTGKLALTANTAGRASGTRTATTPGVWTATDGIRTAYAAAAAANPPELSDLRATGTRLAALASASGGGVHFLDPAGVPDIRRVEAGRVTNGTSWIGLRRNRDHLVTGIEATPLLPGWLALALLLGVAVGAWWREAH